MAAVFVAAGLMSRVFAEGSLQQDRLKQSVQSVLSSMLPLGACTLPFWGRLALKRAS